MIDRKHDLPIIQQAEVLNISRGCVYYLPRPVPDADLAIMRRLDRLHLEFPFAGSRMWRGLLAAEGCKIGRRHVKTLMRRMGIEALYRRPRTTKPEPGHKIYPYLLRGIEITRPNQVWAMDITYILDFYNGRRPHSSLDGTTPDHAYFTALPIRMAA
jgi:putative transposase